MRAGGKSRIATIASVRLKVLHRQIRTGHAVWKIDPLRLSFVVDANHNTCITGRNGSALVAHDKLTRPKMR